MEGETAENDERFMSLLETALRLPPCERDTFLRDTCETEPDLLAALRQQIGREDRMGEFLLEPLLRRPDLEPPFRPGDLVAGRFRIVRELGQGGMGVIYEAIDEKLDQRRALKCAKAGFQRRLPPEARAAMRVTHDNVCRIYEIHTAETSQGPVDFLSMEYVEGETLAERLRREGPLEPSQACEILRQLCLGLGAAHEKGLLHRDLKSNNVMLAGSNRVVITDFGLAREAAAGPETGLAISSSLRGAPAYIAPELWRGAKASIASDIYALGAITYEMLTGRPPFPAETRLARRFRRPPEAPSRLALHIDPAWERAVLKCLDPDPNRRFTSAAELLESLQTPAKGRKSWWWTSGLVALAALVVSLWPPGRAQPPVRLAILPLAVQSTDPQTAETAGSVLHDLSDRLRMAPRGRLVVIPFQEAVQQRVENVKAAVARLGATHVLQGEVRREQDQLVLAATVLDAKNMVQVRDLAGRYDVRTLSGMTRALAGIVTAAFGVTTVLPEEPVAPAAYPYYAQGVALNRRDGRSADLAIPLFEKAIELDGRSASPHAGLAEAYVVKYLMTADRQWLDRAGHALQAAQSRNPDAVVVHLKAGLLARVAGWYDKAVDSYRRAIQLEPSNADAWSGLSRAYESMHGRQADAAQAFQKAVELEPGYYRPHLNFGYFHFRLGNYAEAEKHFQRAVELAPELALGHSNLCGVYADMGRYSDAEQACRRALQFDESAGVYNNLGAILAYLRRDGEAIDYYRRALKLSPRRYLYYQNLGDSSRRMNRTGEAAGAYRQGLELVRRALLDNPSDGYARSLAGYFAARLGDAAGGELEIGQALRFAPQDVKVLRIAVLTYETLRQREKALALLRNAPPDLLRELDRQPDMADFRLDPRFQQLVTQAQTR